ncbi:hypothetical protein E8E12_000875 [Didymella heteroderae]|uniref:Uncharacterized protein n=1 Tax=Didymella heteroderae TaxID=1769908 RepID=A0A9P5BW41_9PLEO|nr:hypothetical protein E8E12_000875 [Didymella heteroderae]
MRSATLVFGLATLISQIPHSFAADQQLPHQVYNVTAVEPPSIPATTVNFTITESFTTTSTTTSTATTIETLTSTATTTETTTLPPPLPPVSTLTVIYPSSDAAPVEVTSVSQVVTSFIPEATFCVGPALYFSSIAGGPFFNGSANVTQYISGTSSCDVEYSTTTKTICATTLTGLASKVTVSECDQEITFSSECGYSLETPTPSPATTSASPLITPAPTVRRLMTYWLAPWQSLTAGDVPSDVDVKVCTVLDDGNMKCQRYQEVWEIVVVTSTVTTSFPVTFSRTVSGPGALIFDSMRLTEQYTSTLTITRHLEHVPTSTSAPTPSSNPTSELASSTATPDVSNAVEPVNTSPLGNSSSVGSVIPSDGTAEPTTTIHVTSIVTERRTSTVTRSRSRTRSSAASVNI